MRKLAILVLLMLTAGPIWKGRCPSRKIAWASNMTTAGASLTLHWPAQAVTQDRLWNW